MRMDVKGVIEVVAGIVAMFIVAWFGKGQDWWVLLIGGFVFFLSWMSIIQGFDNLWKVHVDKKSRGGRPMVPPQEPPKP